MSEPTTVGPKVSFLVAAWNEEDGLKSFLVSYSDLTYPNKELILCAGGSDRTLEIAKAYEDGTVIVIPQETGEGKQRALRKAFPLSHGEIIVLTDADCLLNQEALLELLAPIIGGEESVVNGSCEPLPRQMDIPFVFYQYAAQRVVEKTLLARRYHRSLLGRNCAMSREALEAVYGFDEDVAIGTDAFLARKFVNAGYPIRFVPSRISTAYPQSIPAYGRQRSRWWRNRILLALRFRHTRRLFAASSPVAIGLAMTSLPILGVLAWPFLVLWASLFTYTYGRRVHVVFAPKRNGESIPSGMLLRLPVSIAADSYASILTVVHLLSPKTRERW